VALVLFGYDSVHDAVADSETRTISLHHIHTGEDITITYKRNGRYDPDALKKLDWFLRDWRRSESIHMDPTLIDVVWQVSQEVGAQKPIWVVCGYRAPATNSMLRRRSSGVAQNSQHTVGRAMDFYIPEASLEQIRIAGLRLQRGGVGYYPTSGSPFVHLDTSSVRHWPRMSHDQLARVFPNGRTVHIPSDGQPLAGYALALADLEKRGGTPSAMSLEAARTAGIDAKPKRSLLAAIFNTKDEDEETTTAAPATTATISKPVAVKPVPVSMPRNAVAMLPARPEPIRPAAAPLPAQPRDDAEQSMSVKLAAVPMPPNRPARPVVVAAAAPVALPDPNSPASVIAARGTWDSSEGLKQLSDIGSLKVAAAGGAFGMSTTSLPRALAYAPPVERTSLKKTAAKQQPRAEQPAVATILPTIVASTQTFDDVWLRAVMLAPDLQNFLSATIIGAGNPKDLLAMMRKPSSALAMNFSEDPLRGMATDRFSGDAVVFLDTVTFTTRTAFLQH